MRMVTIPVMSVATPPAHPAVTLRDATVRLGGRAVLDGLSMELAKGRFLAVLGPNGAGKSTLLRVILGVQPLDAGEVLVDGAPPRRRASRVGYVPQLHAIDRDLPLRGRDLVRFGLDGHRFGLPLRPGAGRTRVDAAIAAVGATDYANRPVGRLSGGEQQRLRVAQALLSEPTLLLCDEPLLGLDLAHQHGVTALLNAARRDRDATVLFVTHEINPVLPYVDEVLYLVDGRFALGAPDEVLTAERLSALYGTRVEVVRVGDRVVVVGGEPGDGAGVHHHDHHDALVERPA
jgi:zinc/manganese transport system ATP-binding protein